MALPLRRWYSTWTHPLKWGNSFWILVAHTLELALLGYSRKKFRQGWLKHTFFKNSLEFLGLSLYPWKFWRKQSFTSGNSTKLYYNPWEFQDQKARPMEIPHDCFLIRWKLHSFLLDPWNFHMLFNTPGNSMSSFFGFFSGIAHNACK